MSDNKNIYPTMPSAPPGNVGNNDFFQHRGPPPSYEESQKNDVRPPPPNYFSSLNSQMNGSHGFQYRAYVPHTSTMYTGQVDASMSGHSFQSAAQNLAGGYKVVEFDAGARFKGKGSGSISVPPPPPGCAPTPAQIAAMQGLPVVLKKKKNSFF